jgi:hypothetical protein
MQVSTTSGLGWIWQDKFALHRELNAKFFIKTIPSLLGNTDFDLKNSLPARNFIQQKAATVDV